MLSGVSQDANRIRGAATELVVPSASSEAGLEADICVGDELVGGATRDLRSIATHTTNTSVFSTGKYIYFHLVFACLYMFSECCN